MLQITSSTSPKEISNHIAKLREEKGKEKEVLAVINRALMFGHDFVVNLLWEEALTYQHLVMNEDAKGEGANKEVRSLNLLKMENVVGLAKYYIVRFDLEMWKHRLYRFLGRVSDYKGDFKRAIYYYKKSLKYVKGDPEYLEKRYPRWLEIKAFLSHSLIMSDEVGKGHTLAENAYREFDTDKEALILKLKDYLTWAIWKSGIPIKTVNALLEKKVTFNKKEMLSWLIDAEKLLIPKKQFQYRLGEINLLKKKFLAD